MKHKQKKNSYTCKGCFSWVFFVDRSHCMMFILSFNVDIDECEVDPPCGVNADCSDNEGAFTCSCMPGFQGDPYVACADINECQNPSLFTCHPLASCVNAPANYSCECNDGYEGDGMSCSGMYHEDCINDNNDKKKKDNDDNNYNKSNNYADDNNNNNNDDDNINDINGNDNTWNKINSNNRNDYYDNSSMTWIPLQTCSCTQRHVDKYFFQNLD